MIIAISGKLQSGKDTIADYLVLKHGFTRIAFADKLKDIARDLFNWDGVKDDSGRKLLQELGCQMRNVRKDVWVEFVFEVIKMHKNIDWVIPDVRFINEAVMAKENNAHLWRIDRNLDRTNELCNHISETELDDYTQLFDEIIYNNLSIKDLYNQVDVLLNHKGE
jgi:dephospho-CoA kinase